MKSGPGYRAYAFDLRREREGTSGKRVRPPPHGRAFAEHYSILFVNTFVEFAYIYGNTSLSRLLSPAFRFAPAGGQCACASRFAVERNRPAKSALSLQRRTAFEYESEAASLRKRKAPDSIAWSNHGRQARPVSSVDSVRPVTRKSAIEALGTQFCAGARHLDHPSNSDRGELTPNGSLEIPVRARAWLELHVGKSESPKGRSVIKLSLARPGAHPVACDQSRFLRHHAVLCFTPGGFNE